MFSADVDVAEQCAVAQCDFAGVVDFVGADSEMCGRDGCSRFGVVAFVECLVWCFVLACPVGSVLVVAGDDGVELLLEFVDVVWGWLLI